MNKALPEEPRAPQRAVSTLARAEDGETQRRIQQPVPAEPLRPPVPFSLSGLTFRRCAELPEPIASPANRVGFTATRSRESGRRPRRAAWDRNWRRERRKRGGEDASRNCEDSGSGSGERERGALGVGGGGNASKQSSRKPGRGGREQASSSSEAGGPDPLWASARRQASRAQG
jgi:hypothetical protein